MTPARIRALRRLIAEHEVGLSRTAEEQLLSIMDELLDEVEYLRAQLFVVQPELRAVLQSE